MTCASWRSSGQGRSCAFRCPGCDEFVDVSLERPGTRFAAHHVRLRAGSRRNRRAGVHRRGGRARSLKPRNIRRPRSCRSARSEAGGEPVQIVCGAANARAGLKTALATVGAKLPGDKAITGRQAARRRILRHVVLGQGTGPGGPVRGNPRAACRCARGPGSARVTLSLDDAILELNVTPNRGDAMSVLGIAREVGALLRQPVSADASRPQPVRRADVQRHVPTTLSAAGCPKLVSRVVRGIDNKRQSPGGCASACAAPGCVPISPVVDVTSYVMLELGQPMHAYDLGKLKGGLDARLARHGEKITLLDGKEIELTTDVLVIADTDGAVGMAGVMGGERAPCAARTPRTCCSKRRSSRPAAIAGPRSPSWSRDRCRPALRARRGPGPPGARHRARHPALDRDRRRPGWSRARGLRAEATSAPAPGSGVAP